jgi:hypothetical protein
MSFNRRYRGYSVVAAALVMSACADNSTAPTSMISSLSGRNSGQTNGAGFLHSNSTQYRAQTLPHQSNRSGSATLTSRALIGKDGVTTLTVTTGQLDASGAPGSINKLQEKFLDGNKRLLATKNYQTAGAVQTMTFPGLIRRNFIQTQGNVGGIDGKRTDVVTITERINRRPDLTVTAVAAPDKAKPNEQFIVTANVQEANGDVGAYDDCVLYVDGTEAARINHQWVADGDMVNCAFRTSIATVGTHSLEVRSQNVNPGDWDLANNSKSASIEIVNPEVHLNGTLQAWDYDYDYRQFYNYKYVYSYGDTYEYGYDNTQRQRSSQAYFYAYAYGQPGNNNITSVDMQFTSGGVSLGGLTASNLNSGSCAYLYTNNGNTWLNMCSYDGYSYVNGGTNSGRVVYYSYQFQYNMDANGNYYYSYNYGPNSSDNTWGNGNALAGDDVTLAFRSEGTSGTTLLANATLTMGSWNDNYYYYYYNQPLTCTDGSYNYDWYYGYSYTYHECSEYRQIYRQRNGYTYF